MFRALLIPLALLGCKRAGDVPPAKPPDLEVVSAGNAPRRIVAYHAAKATRQALDVEVDMEIVAGAMGGPTPTLAISLVLSVESVERNGDMKVRATIADATARNRPDSKVDAAALAEPLAAMKGVAIDATLSPNGRLSEIRHDRRNLSDTAQAQLGALTSSFARVMMPWPDIPVGVGAVWRSATPIEQNGIKMKTVNTVQVTAIDGDVISFTTETDLHGDDQKIVQANVSVDVKDIVGTGGGKGTIDLSTLAITSELAAEFRSEMTTPGDTEPTLMKMTLVTRVGNHGAQAAP